MFCNVQSPKSHGSAADEAASPADKPASAADQQTECDDGQVDRQVAFLCFVYFVLRVSWNAAMCQQQQPRLIE